MGPQFEKSKIRLKPKKDPFKISLNTKRTLAGIAAVIILVGFIYISGMKLLEALGGTRIFNFFSGVVGKDLQTDDQNHTNILLLGVGGMGHDGEDLTDTIIIASIDHDNNRINMLSIPRDFYIKSSLGEMRINGLYETGKNKWDSAIGLDFVKETISQTFEIPIHYSVKVDFSGLVKIVDSLGGVDVTVQEAISDPFYPKDGTVEYEPFYMPAGEQHMDGKTALKYARSRKTSSDFDRSRRQQQILVAIKEKAEAQNKLSKSSFIKNLYYSLTDHVETTLGMREILSLALFVEGWDKNDLNSATINDDPTSKGGFLYTPDRAMFGGAFVLLPASESQIKRYIKAMIYEDPAITKIPISILNGTKTNGNAAIVKQDFLRYGVSVDRFGNARNQQIAETTWFINPGWTYANTLASIEKQSQAALINFDESGEITSIQDLHLKALIDFVTSIIKAPVRRAPDEYKNDPRFINSALILEIGADGQKQINGLELSYPLIISSTSESSTPAIETTTTLSQ